MISGAKRLSPAAWDALAEALATYEWYKRPFENMIRRLFGDAPALLARLNFDDPKRRVAAELVDGLRLREVEYQGLVVDALIELASYNERFPSLARLDDGRRKVEMARAALHEVQVVVEAHSLLTQSRAQVREEFERRAAGASARRAHENALRGLHEQFLAMFNAANPQQRGRDFEVLLNQLFDLWDLTPRAAYNLDHEQVDGAFTFRTDDYLLEARWWRKPLEPKELNDFKVKVDGKARNTLGLCVAVTGFTAGAVASHSATQSPLILMDGTDLMPILEGRIGLDEVLERKRRHAAETGNVLFRVLP